MIQAQRGNRDIDVSQMVDATKNLDASIIEIDSPDDAKPHKSAESDCDVEMVGVKMTVSVAEKEIEYSPATASELKQLRPCTMVKTQPIREYLSNLLSTAPAKSAGDTTVDDLLDIFNRWQSSLIFSNPLMDDKKANDLELPIALPPGISNLGATCYLNTQLQCLAQNKEFMHGITSWKAADMTLETGADDAHSERMKSVLTKMQLLLASMVEGSQRTMTTKEFSNALGIEHGEQQDPNEFARLLFDKIHDTFQQHPSLKSLLPNLFEGHTTYATTCETCGTVSIRRESFMDLNLPIEKPEKEEDDGKCATKGWIPRTITDFFKRMSGKEDQAPDADTDLQFCLDRYSTRERLDGDNQYFCGKCDCKRDATRETSLGALPPVLNVQLSRYVFDMTTFMKKKLTDKVLLPQTLQVVTKNTSEAGDAFCTETYVLCAIMKHQGSSAYSGHYVAEVKDFLSGQWFEFNDEKVKLMEKGPSCSYIPATVDTTSASPTEKANEDSGETDKKRTSKLVGSADAYNMYYVEEKFLAKKSLSAFKAIQTQQDELDAVIAGKKEPSTDNVLQTIALERREKFKKLNEECLYDGKAAERLQARRQSLRNDMLFVNSGASMDDVWVDAELLRKFVSCEDRLEELLQIPPGEPILQHQVLLCEHKTGLHPRVARKGKLIPRAAYKSYIEILAKERCLFQEEGENGRFLENLNDCIITPKKNLACTECSESYRKELESKLELVELLKFLYNRLDKSGSFDQNVSSFQNLWDSDSESEEEYNFADQNVYVVSRSFATAFREKIAKDLLRGLNNAATASPVKPPSTTTAPKDVVTIDLEEYNNDVDYSDVKVVDEDLAVVVQIDSVAEGLDALDPESFIFDCMSDELDFQINNKVSCCHGHCTSVRDRRIVRYLKHDTWEALQRFFPSALEHKLPLQGTTAMGPQASAACRECQKEKEIKENLTDRLVGWFDRSLTRDSYALKQFFQKPKRDRAFDKITSGNEMKGEASLSVYLEDDHAFVARSDLALWRKLMQAAERLKQKKKEDPRQVLEQMTTLLRDRDEEWTRYAKAPLQDGFFRPLKCRRHGMTAAIFDGVDDAESVRLSNKIKLVEMVEYDALVASIADIIKLLSSFKENPTADDGCINLVASPPMGEAEEPKHLQPPILRVPRDSDDEMEVDDYLKYDTIRLQPPTGPPVSFQLLPQQCADADCCREWRECQNPDDEVQSLYGSPQKEVVVIDDDTEEQNGTFKLRVFEVEVGADHDQTMSSLMELKCIPSLVAEAEASDGFGPRRSTRRRKPAFPVGVILSEDKVDIRLDHNLAALRVLIYQGCGDISSKLTLVFCPKDSSTDNTPPDGDETSASKSYQPTEPRIWEIPCNFKAEVNEQLLKDFYVKHTDDSELKRLEDPATSFILLRQKIEDSDAEGSLLDVLLQAANTAPEESDSKNGKRKKTSGTRVSKYLSLFFPPTCCCACR